MGNLPKRREALFAGVAVIVFLLSAILPAEAQASRKAFINATVYTMNPAQPWAEAVVMDGNKFAYVGSTKGAKTLINEKTKVFDLKGRMVLPGFIESHVHPVFGTLFSDVAILNQEANREQMLADIKKAAAEKKKDKVLFMMGFKASLFGPHGPTASDLDVIESSKPVIILDYGGHSAWVNTKALQVAGITKDTPDPLPRAHYYRRDKDGNPTGWCIEPMTFIPIIKKSGLISLEYISAAAERLFPVFPSFGITTVFDAGAFLEDDMFKLYLRMEKQKKLPFRVYASHIAESEKSLPHALADLARLEKTYRSRLFTVNTLKIVYDGTLEAQSCAMFDDFLIEKGNRGFELFPPDVLADIVIKTDDAGYNIHIHAIGNRAISDALAAFENLKKRKGPTRTRKTICHVQFFMPDTVARFKALEEVVAQTTPVWMTTDNNTEATVGKEIYERQVLFGSLDRAGVRVTFGSDFPVSSGIEGLNPFNEIEVGHMRRAIGSPDTEVLPPASEKLPIDALLRGYTINGAYQLGVEDRLGSIEVGKLADMIVVEKNLFKQRPSDIHNNSVLITVMDGDIVYQRPEEK
ncbi:MAG TPA: amidohydrolase [Syntrophales bacterium]|nr:amidohydrolase [Syntrophales bacterium]